MRRAVAGLWFIAVLVGAQTAQAQAPPTLTGETLGTAQAGFSGPNPCIGLGGTQYGPVCVLSPSGTIEGNVECDSDSVTGASGTATLTFTGFAMGPYPGTFTETITVTAGGVDPNLPASGANRFVTEFDATFRIDSPAGVVEGRKFLSPERLAGFRRSARCEDSDATGRAVFDAIIEDARYEATIDGGFADRGSTALRISVAEPLQAGGDVTGFFVEAFRSDLLAPEPIRPTTAQQCKKGGEMAFGIFKNQGDCVAFVQTQGKNEPGKNQPK